MIVGASGPAPPARFPVRSSVGRSFRTPLAFGLLFIGGAACGDAPETPPLHEEFARVVNEARDLAESPGISAAVAIDGEIVWAGASGLADVENGVPATSETVYRIASISKPIAAVALMRLVEEGEVDLDADLRTYFPAWPEKEFPVTVRHLLTHTSGVRHYNPGEMEMKEHFDAVEDAIAIFRDDPLLFEPGSQYSYSTYAYNMVAGVVETASGTSFDDYLKTHVFGPAGMASSALEHQGEIVPHRARQYVKTDDAPLVRNAPFADLSIKWAGGGMIATAPDLVRFALALDAGVLLSASSRAQMREPYRLSDGTESNYGLGWRIAEDSSGTWIMHSGGATGGTTHLLRLPARRLAVALTSNVQSGGGLPDAARALADLALESDRLPN